MTLTEKARSLRPYIELAAQSLPDADGLKAKALYNSALSGQKYHW